MIDVFILLLIYRFVKLILWFLFFNILCNSVIMILLFDVLIGWFNVIVLLFGFVLFKIVDFLIFKFLESLCIIFNVCVVNVLFNLNVLILLILRFVCFNEFLIVGIGFKFIMFGLILVWLILIILVNGFKLCFFINVLFVKIIKFVLLLIFDEFVVVIVLFFLNVGCNWVIFFLVVV